MDQTRRAFLVVVALGLYLTLRGYHSRDGDQAFRLPLLLHAQHPAVYARDPFVRAFDDFNPHRGYLACLDLLSRPFGLSAALAAAFAATFALTVASVDRLARTVWADRDRAVGGVAVLAWLVAKAGNLGTNHLFEAMLLDRLVALALGLYAISSWIAPGGGRRIAPASALFAACVIHPSFGLQMGCVMMAGWAAWGLFGRGTAVRRRDALIGIAACGLAVSPSLAMIAREGSKLLDGLPLDDFSALSASVQSPQHMLPHLWREPQWLAGLGYLGLAASSLRGNARWGDARTRLVLLLGVVLAVLFGSWIGIEFVGSVRLTAFQPFRLATLARGLCLVLGAGRVVDLWRRGDAVGRARASALVVGLGSDWSFVAAVVFDVTAMAGDRWPRLRGVGPAAFAACLVYMTRHDTESSQWMLMAGVAAGVLIPTIPIRPKIRRAGIVAAAWALPLVAMLAPLAGEGPFSRRMVHHIRLVETPADDVERLAVWCREHTPGSARFVGPPGPKTFRLWSRREVAFNRAASPYHARGLSEWADRFRDHVGFRGTIAEFARAYLKDRQDLERGFDRMPGDALAALARREGADHVLAASDLAPTEALMLLRREGRYAVYRVADAPDRLARLSDRPGPGSP